MVQRCKSYVLLKETKFKIMIMINCFTHREILEEQITPVVLDVEEHAEDDGEVHEADEDDDHHARVNPPPAPHV